MPSDTPRCTTKALLAGGRAGHHPAIPHCAAGDDCVLRSRAAWTCRPTPQTNKSYILSAPSFIGGRHVTAPACSTSSCGAWRHGAEDSVALGRLQPCGRIATAPDMGGK
jgi:hypothetical protein